MITLSISRGGLAFLQIPLVYRVIVVGRSPACDAILRAPGVAPIHLLLEWLPGEDSGAGGGSWAVADVSRLDLVEDEVIRAEGAPRVFLRGSGMQHFAGFDFRLGDDHLAEDVFSGRLLRNEIRRAIDKTLSSIYAQPTGNNSLENVLEIVRIRKDADTVEGIYHVPFRTKLKRVPRAREIKVQWSSPTSLSILLDEAPYASLHASGETNSKNLPRGRSVELNPTNFSLISTRDHAIFFRLVPALAEAGELRRSRVLRLATAYVGFFLLGVLLFNMPRLKPAVSRPPPRIARVIVKEIVRDPQPPPSNPVPANPPAVAATNASPSAAAPALRTGQVRTTRPGLNTPATNKGSNSVGILSSLQKGQGDQTRVSADMLIDNGARLQQVANEDDGYVAVQRPPSGKVGRKSKASASGLKSALSASSTLSSDEEFSSRSRGPLARKGGTPEFTFSDGMSRSPADESGSGGFGISVEGGLSRDQVLAGLQATRAIIKGCYDTALISNSRAQGKISFQWNISPDGAVTSARLLQSQAKYPSLEECVRDAIRGTQFAAARNGKATTVVYQFMFKKSD